MSKNTELKLDISHKNLFFILLLHEFENEGKCELFLRAKRFN